ncbi:hypothetical protein K7432_000029 [Basidiobolus ranarum]|uniref:Uncharacterized protein n=1 Tax=Basidiobolus ranarum TaxID=34480 RepID=A0ABR2WBX6_9FUNG
MNPNNGLSQNMNDEVPPTEAPPPYTPYPEYPAAGTSQSAYTPQQQSPNGNPYQHNTQNQHAPAQNYSQYYQPGPSNSSYYNPSQNPNTQKQNPYLNPNIPPNAFPGSIPLQPPVPVTGYNQYRPVGYMAPPNVQMNFNFVCKHCGNKGWKRPGKLCSHCPYGQQLIHSGAYQPGVTIAPGVYVVNGRPCYKCKGQGNDTLSVHLPIISSLANTFAPSICPVCRGKGYL